MGDYEAEAPLSGTIGGRQDDELRRLHERILQVSRLATIGEMAAGLAHELNQPLTAISNYARASERILGQGAQKPAEVLEALREIGKEATRAAEFIRRLRNLVRSQPPERAATDPNDVVTELLELVQSDASTRDADVRVALADSLPSIVVNRAQIQLVLLNLVRNAIEALNGQAHGTREIVIRTRAVPGGDVELSVSDTGPGVAPQIADRLFSPFVTTKPEGTGLGLVSSQTIARAHGGTVGHRPNAPRGACFYVRIPAATG
jgi:C4-dicarboxylate-specific signal transduction histidine kinase